ncbi:MAG: GTPase [Gammaproteobacteria bacterium]|nr:GTPase [Gammaproteobacteria bacterium]MBT8104205.1 GTPase [Gammaproteobacteria bacterium]NNK24220.1 GTPase [Woeseiaceae bacterium]
MRKKIIIMGAAGRDFHVFNCLYRDNPGIEVIAFTATQIPHIEDRRYPAVLAGALYADGVPIVPEDELERLLDERDVDEVVFAYSDVSIELVEAQRRRVVDKGVAFSTFDIDGTMLTSQRPVIAVTAVRTGCGKSQVSRRITDILREFGLTTVVIRHPMPYGDLARQQVQRFASYADLKTHDCSIEEREEYEPHIANGAIVYAGTDYQAIFETAEKEADVIVWDGGNNDTPFVKPDLWICVADPHRAGHELQYFPGTVNFQRADLILIGKVGYADEANIELIRTHATRVNPDAQVILRKSPLSVPDPDAIANKRVLVIEDGPTTTHGGMPFGAGVLAATQYGASELVDPRPYAVGEIAATFDEYPDIGDLLPAMGYGESQISDLEATVNATDCDLVLVATPIDLTRLIDIDRPYMRIGYSLEPVDGALATAVRNAVGLRA